jgi:hypothetical protein
MTLDCVPHQVTELRTRLDRAVAAQQQESVSQVIHLQGAVASALATAQVTDCV